MAIKIDNSTLRQPLSKLLGYDDYHLEQFTWNTLYTNPGNGFNGGIYLVEGSVLHRHGSVAWQMVMKVLLSTDAHGLYERNPVLDPAHPHFAVREREVYNSGMLADLPDGLRAPKFLGAEERGDEVWLWLEHIRTDRAANLSFDDYVAAAHRIGRWNAAHLANHPSAQFPWLARGVIDYFSDWFVHNTYCRMLEETPDIWDGPSVQSRVHHKLRANVEAYLDSRSKLLTIIRDLPQCICHGDYYARNLLIPIGGRTRETVAVDWAFTGLSCIGSDVGQLVMASIVFRECPTQDFRSIFDACVDAYFAGLRDNGWVGEFAQVRLGCICSAICRLSIWGVQRALSLLANPPSTSRTDTNPIDWYLLMSEFAFNDLLPEVLERL